MSAYAWKHGDTLVARLDRPYPDIIRILAYFRHMVELAPWQRAASHDFIAELAQGRPVFGPARDVRKHALKLADSAYTLAVETIVVGGAAADLRLSAGGFINELYASHVGTCAFRGQP